jgi:hypothetical protein
MIISFLLSYPFKAAAMSITMEADRIDIIAMEDTGDSFVDDDVDQNSSDTSDDDDFGSIIVS